MADPIANFNFVDGVNLDDSKFTPQQILASQELSRQYLEDRYSNLDLSPVSGLHDSVIRPTAQMLLIARGFIEEYNKSRTLYDALNNDGDEAVVDGILSNVLISRRAGSKATGTVKINVENYDINQNISSSSYFITADGLKFFPITSYAATSTPNVISDIEIFKSNIGNSGYFMVDVVAENVGEVYNIKSGTQLDFSGSIDGVISSVALSQFNGGESNESNQSVYNRIISSLSARNMTSPLAIDQSLKDNFPSVLTTSTHGVASKYMKRNSHNLLGIKVGCACDVYVKNAYAPTIKEVHAVASKVLSGVETDEFVVTISKNDFPGHYDVLSIKPISQNKIIGSYEILQKTRNVVDIQAQNDIHTVDEGVFSRYASTEVRFSKSADPSIDEVAVMCEVYGLADIDKMQDYANSGGSQTALIDTLIKACVPCFISIDPITVRVNSSSKTTELLVSSEIFSYILGIDPSTDHLRADVIVSKILAMDGVVGVDLPIRINASIMVPSQTPETISTSTISTLSIPSIPSKFVGPETVGLFVKDGRTKINIVKVS